MLFQPGWRYTANMFVFTFLEHFLIWMFMVGLAGSSVVVVVSFIDDVIELMEK